MRATANCSLQQALSSEASGVVKQALVLARRRGHAQVTPLHVASTMLASSTGLFRLACLQSHSHPLQCKALDLCFNVALNRLPALGPHSSPTPAISNALLAAFKRAQAHQRRGSVENQHQPILTVKVELEQLVISILDDPSVSRVMKEAGFMSTQVKTNVEKAVTLELSSEPKSVKTAAPEQLGTDDVEVVIDALLTRRQKKSLVLVGECISTLDKLVRLLMSRAEKGDVPEDLRGVKFVNLPALYSFCNLGREEVEDKMREVGSVVGEGVVLYLGDLKWVSDYREQRRSYYCSIEHMVMEIGRIVWGMAQVERFWVLGIATFQSYMKCRNGHHSLENVWGLHPITIPTNTLGFSLVSQRQGEVNLSCCNECSAKFEAEARILRCRRSDMEPTLSMLPCWLQKTEEYDEKSEAMKELSKKWNSFCSSSHKQPSPPSPSTSCFSIEPMRSDFSDKENNYWASNLNKMCNALEEKVPSQRHIIPEIAGTILQCRSGMLPRKCCTSVKEDTWLLFVGPDESRAKESLARELAKIVFGSYASFLSTDTGSLARSVSENPHRVFFVEDFEGADYWLRMGVKRGIQSGKFGEDVGLCDAIVILSGSGGENGGGGGGGGRLFLDLNISVGDDVSVGDDLGIVESVDRRVVFSAQG